jgi:hypothetical protein
VSEEAEEFDCSIWEGLSVVWQTTSDLVTYYGSGPDWSWDRMARRATRLLKQWQAEGKVEGSNAGRYWLWRLPAGGPQ